MELFMNVNIQEEDLSFYNRAIQSIRDIQPQRIQELAKKYLNWEEMTIVTAG